MKDKVLVLTYPPDLGGGGGGAFLLINKSLILHLQTRVWLDYFCTKVTSLTSHGSSKSCMWVFNREKILYAVYIHAINLRL